MADVNALDLAFVVDTTGSMGNLIAAARRQMVATLDALRQASAVALRCAVVEYRDHPPQDRLLTRVHGFTDDLKKVQKTIDKLRADGGGDGPEAVFDGIAAAVRDLEWRPHARRLAVLVGDAPPHGVGAGGDGFPRGCPCGATVDSTTALAEAARVTVYALGLTPCVAKSFGRLARLTGGDYFAADEGDACLERIEALLRAEFGDLEFDRSVLAAVEADPSASVDALAEQLAVGWPRVASSLSRLGSRGLLPQGARTFDPASVSV